MHELPVVLDIINVVTDEAKKQNFTKVTSIDLVIGELSSIIDESVQMYFDIASRDTPCQNARLTFEHIPATLKCRNCSLEFPHKKSFQCPECNGDAYLVKGSGTEFYIKSFNGE